MLLLIPFVLPHLNASIYMHILSFIYSGGPLMGPFRYDSLLFFLDCFINKIFLQLFFILCLQSFLYCIFLLAFLHCPVFISTTTYVPEIYLLIKLLSIFFFTYIFPFPRNCIWNSEFCSGHELSGVESGRFRNFFLLHRNK